MDPPHTLAMRFRDEHKPPYLTGGSRRDRWLLRAVIVTLCWSLCVAFVAHASASSGGAEFVVKHEKTGGAPVGSPNEAAPKKKKAKRKRRPPLLVISGSSLSSRTLLDEGRPIKLRYRVRARVRKVRVRAIVRTKGGTYIRTLELGVHKTGVRQVAALSQAELGVRRPGSYRIRLSIADGKGRRAQLASGVATWLEFDFADHRFPVVGRFSFGGDGALFGAGRPGHTHQGQDVVADSGTPLVAPRAGLITWVKYQASGAGYYVVLAADDGRDYVFMHLLRGSTAVKQGQKVITGQLLGKVGATGDASGPHLHFEIWTGGPWQLGGHPVDPLPLLRSWFAHAPGGAVLTASATAASSGPLDND